jgi:hypothetical protein
VHMRVLGKRLADDAEHLDQELAKIVQDHRTLLFGAGGCGRKGAPKTVRVRKQAIRPLSSQMNPPSDAERGQLMGRQFSAAPRESDATQIPEGEFPGPPEMDRDVGEEPVVSRVVNTLDPAAVDAEEWGDHVAGEAHSGTWIDLPVVASFHRCWSNRPRKTASEASSE